MPELISIVVIGRNEEQNIARCLESCLASDWGNKEIIYCDSESTDRTVEIARGFPVRIIVHKNERRNPSIGRNIGLRVATGDYVYFIDADMVLDPKFLNSAFLILVSQKSIACVIGSRLEVRLDNPYVRLIDSSWGIVNHSYAKPQEIDSPGGGGGLFKRQAVLDAGGYFERFNASEEPILGRQLRRLGYRIMLIDATMAYHDVGIHSMRQYIWFRARQAKQGANALILQEKIDRSAYRVAQKHVVEFVLLTGWVVVFMLAGRYRLWLICMSALALAAWFAYKYFNLRAHPRQNLFFLHEYILGKPLHIIFQLFYVAKMLLTREHPSRRPDGQIISDTGSPR